MLAPLRRQSLIPPPGHANRTSQIPPGGRPCCRRRQSLIPPPGHANRPARILPAGRPCWRCPAGKALSHRLATPTVWLKSRPAAAHVGASPPAKPYATAGPRQQSGPNPACRVPMLAPSAVKTLSHRLTTPTGRLKSCPAADHVGAFPPAKPYPTAGQRQQAGPNPARRPSMLPPPLAGGRRL